MFNASSEKEPFNLKTTSMLNGHLLLVVVRVIHLQILDDEPLAPKNPWPRRDLNTQPSDLESDALPLRHGVIVCGALHHVAWAHPLLVRTMRVAWGCGTQRAVNLWLLSPLINQSISWQIQENQSWPDIGSWKGLFVRFWVSKQRKKEYVACRGIEPVTSVVHKWFCANNASHRRLLLGLHWKLEPNVRKVKRAEP